LRIKSQWFKPGKEKTPQELAGAVAFNAWRIAENSLRNMRRADFELEVGAQYFHFLAEFLIFLIQVADRIAYLRFSAEFRAAYTTELAQRIAANLAENKERLLGGCMDAHKREFIEKLNQRAGEYAEFEYGNDGASFSFLRYLAHCMGEVVEERDSHWVTGQIMTTEGPAAVELLEKNMRGLLETEPRRRSARSNVSVE
jgi:hypothetical protein